MGSVFKAASASLTRAHPDFKVLFDVVAVFRGVFVFRAHGNGLFGAQVRAAAAIGQRLPIYLTTRISWHASLMRISRAGQLLAHPAQPMHLFGSKTGLPLKRAGTGRGLIGYESVTLPALRQRAGFFNFADKRHGFSPLPTNKRYDQTAYRHPEQQRIIAHRWSIRYRACVAAMSVTPKTMAV